jgi:hypothetical protein
MKTFKAICAALVLVISLSIPIFADGGEVHTPGRSSVVIGEPGVIDPKAEENGNKTNADGDDGYSVLADIIWAVASIF